MTRDPDNPGAQSVVALALAGVFGVAPDLAAEEMAAPPPVIVHWEAESPSREEPLPEAPAPSGPMLFPDGTGASALSDGETVSDFFEGAEEGMDNITLDDANGQADLIQETVVFAGDHGFHLTNPGFADTSVAINPGIQVGGETKLAFASKFGLLAADQIAKVQVSTDGGGVFSDTVWSRPGTDSPGGGFESVEIDLSGYAGQTVHLRFVLDFHGGSAYDGTSTAVGWFFDSISIGETPARPFYSIGEPTDSEQYNLERINRSRADALAEADRLVALASSGDDPDIISAISFFDINPADIRAQYEWAIDNGHLAASAQPLAFNAELIEAARLHTRDMLENDFQGHTTSSTPPADAPYAAGADLAGRVTAVGYSYAGLGESVYAHARSVIHGHAGFLIDWGHRNAPERTDYNPDFDDQGMQNPPGHRFLNHNPDFQEVGIGFLEGSNDDVGPFLVTQDFGRPGSGGQFITGVALADMDSDDFHDPGEGLGGVVVTAEPADGSTPRPAYRARTSSSGGYTLPVPGDGRYTVSFSHRKYGTVSVPCTMSGGENFKIDWIPEILYLDDFGEDAEDPSTMELRFFDAGIDGNPRLETTTDLRTGFTEEATATLSPRDDSGYRTFSYEKPAGSSHFARVVIE